MKNLVLCVFIMMGVLSFTYAENINECKTDIYFGNGVWNEYEDAAKSQLRLQKRIIDIEIVNGEPLLKAKYGNVKLAYNWGQGHVLDVLEVYFQLRESGQLDGIGFYTAIAALTVSYPHITLSAIATQALMEPFTRDWEAGNVYEMWQKYYNESFKLGHRVLLVSHSQGNMFANRIHDSIDPKGYQDYFANLQVASPAREVKAPKGDHVTLYDDPIINPIPGSMVGNANGSPGHAFVKAYLDQEDPYTKIADKIKELLPTLDSEASQWETDQESNKNTCDYKITVQHRFDPGIEMPFDVYPFAPSKKLYQVNGEWVKASCGGTTIMGEDRDILTWEGKQDDECLMIDNPLKEVIKKIDSHKLRIYATCDVVTVITSFYSYDIWDWVASRSGMACYSRVGYYTKNYTYVSLEEDSINTIQLYPRAPQGTDYLSKVKLVFAPIYAEAVQYVNSKYDEYTSKYSVDGILSKRGFDVKCRDPDDGYYYHIGAGCFADPTLNLQEP
ncbi:MAG: hypothetical protein ABXS92_06130 [Sulfurimonas sp.]